MSGRLKNARPAGRPIAFGLSLIGAVWLVAGCATPGGRLHEDPTATLATLAAQRAQDQTEPYWPCQLAAAQLAGGQRGAAQAYLDTALSLDPDYAPAAVLLSRIQYEDGRFTAAAARLQGLLDRNANAPDAVRVALALNLQALGQPEQATAVLAPCDGQDSAVATARVFTRLQGAEFKNSLTAATAAVTRNPDSAANQNNYGVSLLYAGRPRAARQAFQQALAIAPDLPGALYNLAIVENFYFFDETAGREYFRRYQSASRDNFDPDDLASALAGNALAGSQASLNPAEVTDGH